MYGEILAFQCQSGVDYCESTKLMMEWVEINQIERKAGMPESHAFLKQRDK